MCEKLCDGQHGLVIFSRTVDKCTRQDIPPALMPIRARHEQRGILPHCLPQRSRVSILEQPCYEPGHDHEGHARTLAADEPKDMLTLHPPRLGREIGPGGKKPRMRAAAVDPTSALY
jgi:hypothetical protein